MFTRAPSIIDPEKLDFLSFAEGSASAPPLQPDSSSTEVIRVDQLGFAEQFTIWSIRLWFDMMRTGQGGLTPLHDAFEAAGIAAALGPFDGLMTVLNDLSNRPIELFPRRHPVLSKGEMRLLSILARPSGPSRSRLIAGMVSCNGGVLARAMLKPLDQALEEKHLRPVERDWVFGEDYA